MQHPPDKKWRRFGIKLEKHDAKLSSLLPKIIKWCDLFFNLRTELQLLKHNSLHLFKVRQWRLQNQGLKSPDIAEVSNLREQRPTLADGGLLSRSWGSKVLGDAYNRERTGLLCWGGRCTVSMGLLLGGDLSSFPSSALLQLQSFSLSFPPNEEKTRTFKHNDTQTWIKGKTTVYSVLLLHHTLD